MSQEQEKTLDRFARVNGARVNGFTCTFKGDWNDEKDKFVKDMTSRKFKVNDQGLSTIDCWGPSPEDCAYGHKINVTFPRRKKMSENAVKLVKKTIKPYLEKTYGGCRLHYSYLLDERTVESSTRDITVENMEEIAKKISSRW